MKIKTLIVDDEPIARDRVRRMLHEETDIEIIGECGNGAEAVVFIDDNKPDLVFLDIQMPEMNGFEVLQAINPEKPPAIIFVTAFDQYAIRASMFTRSIICSNLRSQTFKTEQSGEERTTENPPDKFDERLASLLKDLTNHKNI